MAIELVAGISSWYTDFVFVPLPDLRESARSLCRKALTLTYRTLARMDALEEAFDAGWENPGWSNHGSPSYWWAMWREYPAARAVYTQEILKALVVMDSQSRHHPRRAELREISAVVEKQLSPGFKYTPAVSRQWAGQIEWLGDERLHASHRKYLQYQWPAWYRQYGWDDPPTKETHKIDPEPSYGRKSESKFRVWFPDSRHAFANKQHVIRNSERDRAARASNHVGSPFTGASS